MSGKPDTKKRAKVRKLLKLKAWKSASTRAVAKEAKCSKFLVNAVRREMIHYGEHPPSKRYHPYSAVRGGYVFSPSGKVVSTAMLD